MQGSFKDYFSLVVYLQISVNIRVGDVHALTGTLSMFVTHFKCLWRLVSLRLCFLPLLFCPSFVSVRQCCLIHEMCFILFLTFFFSFFLFQDQSKIMPVQLRSNFRSLILHAIDVILRTGAHNTDV